jgi:hypothetical protein
MFMSSGYNAIVNFDKVVLRARVDRVIVDRPLVEFSVVERGGAQQKHLGKPE